MAVSFWLDSYRLSRISACLIAWIGALVRSLLRWYGRIGCSSAKRAAADRHCDGPPGRQTVCSLAPEGVWQRVGLRDPVAAEGPVHCRDELALDQREATERFAGDVNVPSRYENGKSKPPLALVKRGLRCSTVTPNCRARSDRHSVPRFRVSSHGYQPHQDPRRLCL
ncbi:type II toxin-antitoxin system MqsA family antitoxin [uncultured Lamprocystis sp.]|uniref:type II toxin-antitoxin system MqsA family antitoxin n=1 Tax=uncultured Lamprocystis sp. TaxID=543132 RepID=UPI0034309559